MINSLSPLTPSCLHVGAPCSQMVNLHMHSSISIFDLCNIQLMQESAGHHPYASQGASIFQSNSLSIKSRFVVKSIVRWSICAQQISLNGKETNCQGLKCFAMKQNIYTFIQGRNFEFCPWKINQTRSNISFKHKSSDNESFPLYSAHCVFCNYVFVGFNKSRICHKSSM